MAVSRQEVSDIGKVVFFDERQTQLADCLGTYSFARQTSPLRTPVGAPRSVIAVASNLEEGIDHRKFNQSCQ